MNEQIAKQWVEALRSGKYNQGQGFLCRIDANGNKYHCCLGVLCEILGVKGEKIDLEEDPDTRDIIDSGQTIIAYDYCVKLPPEVVFKSAEFVNPTGNPRIFGVNGDMDTLADLNDGTFSRSFTFNEIADIIEEKWSNL
jgi:hypothetical protein